MTQLTVYPGHPLNGSIRVPGDKSISHRALLLGALAEGTSRIRGFLPAADCLATIACLRALGIRVVRRGAHVIVHGHGLRGFRSPRAPLHCGRSGTTMRLLAGILAGQDFDTVLTGDPQLLRRPMRRVVEPLRRMGAAIEDTDGHAPLIIHGRRLHGGEHDLPVASAQVKSALLLAGLYADGPTTVREPMPSRDHTERMLSSQICPIPGAPPPLLRSPSGWTIDPHSIAHLEPLDLAVPGDFSSAAFLLAAALLIPHSAVTVRNVGVNPTRTGLLDVLRQMGAEILIEDERMEGNEPVAHITARSSDLQGVPVSGPTVVRMIDEFPILAVVATQATGQTVVRDAGELRVKESDRIASITEELRKMGAHIEPLPDGFVVEGPTPLKGTRVTGHGDHRLAMALFVAGLVADGETIIEGTEYIEDSFPGFVETMVTIGAQCD